MPSRGLSQVIGNLQASGLPARTPVISMAKGLVPPDGLAPTTLLNQAFGVDRVACIGGPAHAWRWSPTAPGWSPLLERPPRDAIASVFMRAGVVCEQSNDPVGVELAGVAKNAARSPRARPRARA